MLTAILRAPALRLSLPTREQLRTILANRSMPSLPREHWLASFVLATFAGLYLLVGLSVLGVSGPDGRAYARPHANLPAAVRANQLPLLEPQKLVPLAPQDALARNAAVPVSALPNPAARPFALLSKTDIDRMRAIDCLTQAIYYEAAIEPVDGQRAVAQVILNRVRHPAYPKTVCGVIYQGSERATGCQFSYTCDGSLARRPVPAIWNRIRLVAQAALAGNVYAPVGWATHYHTNWVVPYWASSLSKVANVGTHIFYRWTGGWGTGSAFTNRYAGLEPDVRALGRKAPVDPVDAAAAAAALAALDAAKMTPEQIAAAEKLPDGTVAAPSSVDSFQRAVLRRYEPLPGSAVTAILASQAKSGGKPGSASMRWALAGEAAAPSAAPLGKKAEPAAEPKKVEAPAATPAPAPAAAEGTGATKE